MRLTTRSTRRGKRDQACGRHRRRSLSTQPQTATALDLDPRDVEATLEPLERATMLPPRAFVDPGVFEWELETIFSGWICVGHVSPRRRAGQLPDARDRHRQRRRDGRRGRPPARLPQRLPASRGEADRRARGKRPPPGPVSLPRLVLRARRRAEGDAPHGRGRGLRHLVLGADAGAGRHRRRAWCWSTSAARRPTSSAHVGELAGYLERYRVGALRSRRPGLLSRSRPTGRRSPRTTASACTAPASTRSSTRSATT